MARRALRVCGRYLLTLVLVAFLLAACGPEAKRTRAGGPGADIGNRKETVELHGEVRGERSIYADTPLKVPGQQE
ncbi:hypothetical protein [Sphaerobacter thermophilus]|jgi:hypothetical protein|uniref:Uncharacterized protein n=1 Tax=Sphaerobacter thermophilus (strain ATCC 49802 / DSM 20745 / KCCM 41009 / NCIMB 13125 / S 6022) TaxID=479434 RepID=D1CAE8_SPHTD|nr:hypothetical protein [Sphaerobacter thermophilus]ACZ40791.1 hypothetical protein Sthe_3391 [Sphaerobacter thermophilus DSM 20745]PZN67289.1 MAG: hypothetical protein DIU58_03720 [Sphaerobacter thermophilus]